MRNNRPFVGDPKKAVRDPELPSDDCDQKLERKLASLTDEELEECITKLDSAAIKARHFLWSRRSRKFGGN